MLLKNESRGTGGGVGGGGSSLIGKLCSKHVTDETFASLCTCKSAILIMSSSMHICFEITYKLYSIKFLDI